MTFERVVLVAGAAAFGFFGVLFLLAFDRVARALGITAAPAGRVDLEAIYVGFELGFAAFLIACATRDAWLAPGLVASGCGFAGFAAGRLWGLARHRGAARYLWGILALEVAGAALSFYAACRL